MTNLRDNIKLIDEFNKTDYDYNILKEIYNYLKHSFNISNEQIIYIMKSVINADNIKECINVNYFMNSILYERYIQNKKIINKYYHKNKFANNYEEFCKLINHRNSYILFENITDINYYSVLWDSIHSS